MSLVKKINNRRKRRALRVRKDIRLDHKNNKIRISIFRSLSDMYVQAIDDSQGKTLASISTYKIKEKMSKTEASAKIGKDFADVLKSKGINEVIIDRGSFKYHGRLKSFADALREGGLKV